MADEANIPIASAVDPDFLQHPALDDLTAALASIKQEHASVCENIKAYRENYYTDYCEDENELEKTTGPIERNPEPFASGSIKARPILRKYAQALCERADLDVRLEVAEEAVRDVDLTPQQVKADVKSYVAICEKKIASQQQRCDSLQKQVEQLTKAVRRIVTHPTFGSDFANDQVFETITSVEEIEVLTDSDDDDEDEAMTEVAMVQRSGSRAAKKRQKKKDKKKAMAQLTKANDSQRSLCNLEIEPWIASQDLKALYAKIKKNVVMDGLKWSKNCNLVDVAFGVKKIACTVVTPHSLPIDTIVDMTENSFADEIQSMTITSMSLL